MALASACTASSEDVRPPSTELFFPSGLQVAPDESVLFVANGNSELRYDSGTLSVVDLVAARQVAAAWTGSNHTVAEGCTQDLDFRETLVCEEAPFIKGDQSVRIGNFATDVAIQDFAKRDAGAGRPAAAAGHVRVFVPTRGDPSVAWADYDGSKLSCNTDGEPFGLCDDAHRLTAPENDPNAESGIPDEPFGVFVDAVNGFAVVTHQTTGSVSMIDSDYEATSATIVDVRAGIFAGDSYGVSGATGVSGRLEPNLGSVIYVGSRTDDRIQTFTFARPPSGSQPYLVQGEYFFLDSVGTGSGVGNSTDTRGITFSGDGNHMYLVNRSPPSLQIYDTSIGADGSPVNLPIAAIDICREASTLTVLGSGAEERVYVTCFQSGELYVINPSGQAEVEDILTVGRGPYAVTASPNNKQLYISNFLEDTISVVDVNPSSPYRNRVVLRIGVPQVSQ